MQKTIVITDLTQMPTRNRVCIVGINESGQCIRPVTEVREEGVPKDLLYPGPQLIVCPRAKVRFDFHQVPVEPPYIEDLGFDPDSITYQGFCDDAEWDQVLQNSSFSTVDDIYDSLLQEHRWVNPGASTRSIGTLPQVRITAVKLPEWSGKLRYRLSFTDSTGFPYDIPVSDLVFREFSYTEVKKRNRSPSAVAEQIMRLLTSADRLYLRLGLARPWVNPNTRIVGCWMQVTGIHTFPDYLGGKSFADF